MSYSFSVHAATADEAVAKVTEQLDNVVQGQPIHAADRELALATAKAFIALVPAVDGHDFNVTVHGSVTSFGGDTLTSASVGVSVGTIRRDL